MPAKRVIPCLDVTEGRVVKGVRFKDLRDAGDPAELAALYDREGADEIVFLDITASSDIRKILLDAVARTADQATGIAALQSQFKNTVDWQVAIDGIGKADNPNFESYMPAYNESLGLVGSGGKFLTKWGNTAGLDMDKEIQSLQDQLQAIWNKAP